MNELIPCYRCGLLCYCPQCDSAHKDSPHVEIARLTRELAEARCAAAVAAEQRDTAEGRAERLEEELASVRSEATVDAVLDATEWRATPDATVTRRVREALGVKP